MYINGNTMTGDEHKSHNNQLRCGIPKMKRQSRVESPCAYKIKLLVMPALEIIKFKYQKARSARAKLYPLSLWEKEVGANQCARVTFKTQLTTNTSTEMLRVVLLICEWHYWFWTAIIRSWDDSHWSSPSEDMKPQGDKSKLALRCQQWNWWSSASLTKVLQFKHTANSLSIVAWYYLLKHQKEMVPAIE